MRARPRPMPERSSSTGVPIESFSVVRVAHQHAAFGEIGGLPANLAAPLPQHDRQIARQPVVAAPVADLGLAQERDEAGLQLGGEVRGILTRAVDRARRSARRAPKRA